VKRSGFCFPVEPRAYWYLVHVLIVRCFVNLGLRGAQFYGQSLHCSLLFLIDLVFGYLTLELERSRSAFRFVSRSESRPMPHAQNAKPPRAGLFLPSRRG
jgi:hypothetical protein